MASKHSKNKKISHVVEQTSIQPSGSIRPIDAAIILSLVFLAFFPSLSGEFLNYDDTLNFTENPHYRGLRPTQIKWMFTTFHMGHYQPITWLTLGFDAEIGRLVREDPMWPLPYRITNLLFHALNAILLLLLLRKFLRFMPVDSNANAWSRPALLVSTLFFAVNPMRVESVAWITERRDVVSAFCLLLMLHAWMDYRFQPEKKQLFRLAHVWFFLGMMSKEILMMTPVVLVVMDWYPFRKIRDDGNLKAFLSTLRDSIREKQLLFIIAFIFGAVVTLGDQEQNWLMTMDSHPLMARIAQASFAVPFYFIASVIPIRLLPIYEMRLPLDITQWYFIASMALTLGLAFLAWTLRRRFPVFVSCFLTYLLFLFPVSGFVQTGQQLVACRYSYLPAMSMSVLLLVALRWALLRNSSRIAKKWLLGVCGVCILLLAAETFRYSSKWTTSRNLWEYTVSQTDKSTFAFNNLGYLLLIEKKYETALQYFEKAVEIEPRNAEAYNNLGIVLEKLGDASGAVSAYQKAIDLGISRIQTFLSAGDLQLGRGENQGAVVLYESALRLRPDLAAPHINLGLALARQKQFEKAIEHYRKALEMDPRLHLAHYNLALSLDSLGRRDEATMEIRRALAIRSDHEGSLGKLREWTTGDGR